MTDIVCLGELLIDMFPAEVGRRLVEVTAFHPKPGGAPANVAVAAARLGASSAFVGKVGDDLFGHHLAQVLSEEGVDIRGLRFDEEVRTTMAIIAMPDENTAEFVFYRNPGADTRLRPGELDTTLFESARAFHFGSLSLTDEPVRSTTREAVRLAREAGALISFDVNYRPSLWPSADTAKATVMEMIPQVNLLKVNESELELLAESDLEAGARQLLGMGPALIVVTLGPGGSYFAFEGGGRRVPGYAVETVDAVGCGDAFTAGLLSQLTAEADWRTALAERRLMECLGYANGVGALTALKAGVIPALPTASQVNDFLQNHLIEVENK